MSFPCQECDKSFTKKSSLKTHVDSIHLGIRYTCLHFDCRFTRPTYISARALRDHKKYKHDGVQRQGSRFACGKCDKSFAQKYKLSEHIDYKHSSKTFTCDECDEEFDGKSKLVYHVRTNHQAEVQPSRQSIREQEQETSTQTFFNSISEKIKDFKKERECCIPGCYIIDLGYGLKGGEKIVCKKHAHLVDNAIKLDRPCRFKECMKSGGIVIGNYKFCSHHSKVIKEMGLPQETFVKKRWTPTCKHEGCSKVPSFDNATKCKEHATNTVSDDTRKCQVHDCKDKRRPRYGVYGGKPTHCQEHGLELGMTDLTGCFCVEQGCSKRASYKKDIDKVAEYCVEHKPEGYFIQVKTCEESTCQAQPSFGPKGTSEMMYCSKHGKKLGYVDNRNKRCIHEGCNLGRSFGPEGGERFWCLEHKTPESVNLVESFCEMPCCDDENRVQAAHFHPEYENKGSEFYKKRICSFARRAMIEDAMMENDIDRVKSLLEHFKMKKVLTLNAQSAFRFVCEKGYHKELSDCEYIRFDEKVHDGRKIIGNKRPDIFYKWKIDGLGYGIHIEYDENGDHEDDDERLRIIEKESGCVGNIYVIRVHGGHDTKDPVCTRVHISDNFEYYKVTESGKEVALDVVDLVLERIDWIHKSLKPDSKNWKVVV